MEVLGANAWDLSLFHIGVPEFESHLPSTFQLPGKEQGLAPEDGSLITK